MHAEKDPLGRLQKPRSKMSRLHMQVITVPTEGRVRYKAASRSVTLSHRRSSAAASEPSQLRLP